LCEPFTPLKNSITTTGTVGEEAGYQVISDGFAEEAGFLKVAYPAVFRIMFRESRIDVGT
jgi:hypothetical protein